MFHGVTRVIQLNAALLNMSNRDPFKVKKLKDLISVQHAKWIAVRLRRCMGFHNRSIEESARRMYLQPPKGRRHDRSSQGSRGEFARLSTVLCQRSGPRATREEDTRVFGATAGARRGKGPAPKRLGEDTRVSGATAGARRGKGPAPKRLVKPKLCASPLHAGESAAESTPAETGWTTQRSVREELEGNGGALAALDITCRVLTTINANPFRKLKPRFRVALAAPSPQVAAHFRGLVSSMLRDPCTDFPRDEITLRAHKTTDQK